MSDPSREAERLERILAPATREEIGDILAWMFKVLGNPNATAETMLAKSEAHVMAMSKYPRWAILEARNAFIAGEVAGHATGWMPDPPVLGAEVLRRVEDDRMRLVRARRLAKERDDLRREDAGGGGRIDPAVRAEVMERMARMREVNEANRRVPPALPTRHDLSAYYVRRPPEPELSRALTPEDVAHVKDRPVTAMRTAGSFSPFKR